VRCCRMGAPSFGEGAHMNNRFGLKDFFQIVLLLAVLVLVWLSMLQRDREWVLQRDMLEKLGAIEKKLASGVVASGPVRSSAQQTETSRDESWARPGVKIEWQKPWDFATDPRTQPGFAEGGEFTEIFEAQPPKVTPNIASDVYGRRVIDRVCDTLGAYDPQTLEFRGVLAAAWQQDPAGLWIRVRLRDGLRFSDGEPLTAEDVRWTFDDYIFNPSMETERVRATLDQIEDVKVIDPRTVEFTFNRSLSFNLTYTLGNYVLPKHYYSKLQPSQINSATGLLVGSGPFKLERLDVENQWTPGQDLVLVRNENFWGPRPPLDRMRFKVVADSTSRLAAYQSDEGDMITPTSPQFVKKTKEAGWDTLNFSPRWVNMRSGYSFIVWNEGKNSGRQTPFADKRVRQAMTLCLDRERMIKDIWEGVGEVSQGPVNPESPVFASDIKPWPFDPTKGKALLAEAGWQDRNGDGILENEKGDRFEFEFTRSGSDEISERISTFIKDSYARVGIVMIVKPIDWAAMSDILKARSFDALTMAWSASAPESDPRQIFHSESIKEGGDNFAQWNSPAADKAIDGIRTTIDFEARRKVWHEFQAVIHEEQPYTFIRVAPWLRFVKKSIGNVETYKSGLEPWEFFRAAPAAGSAE
jgi:peptide/nickel transport system substrate-binding protein